MLLGQKWHTEPSQRQSGFRSSDMAIWVFWACKHVKNDIFSYISQPHTRSRSGDRKPQKKMFFFLRPLPFSSLFTLHYCIKAFLSLPMICIFQPKLSIFIMIYFCEFLTFANDFRCKTYLLFMKKQVGKFWSAFSQHMLPKFWFEYGSYFAFFSQFLDILDFFKK